MTDDILTASEQIQVPVVQDNDNDQISNISFTEVSRNLFNEEVKLPWYSSDKRDAVDESLDSIYEIAAAHHLPVIDFVMQDPEYAVMCVEMSYAKWTNVLTQASITGAIASEEGNVAVTKNQIKALELRIKQAKSELDNITDLAMAFAGSGTKRDHLIRTLYMNAIMHKDSRRIISTMRQRRFYHLQGQP